MPYESDAQRRYFNANREELEAQGVDVDEWNDSSRGKKLPERAKKKKRKKKASIKLATSRVHGTGLFTNVNIKKGTKFARAMVRMRGKDAQSRYELTKAARYTNHSQDPSAQMVKVGNEVYLVALKAIPADTEVLVDYRKTASVLGPGSYITFKGKKRTTWEQLEKQAQGGVSFRDRLGAMDPTARNALLGGGAGAVIGGGVGLLGSLAGPGRNKLDAGMAAHLLNQGVPAATVRKLQAGQSLNDSDHDALTQFNVDLDEIAPKGSYLMNMLDNSAGGMLAGGATGAVLGGGLTELDRAVITPSVIREDAARRAADAGQQLQKMVPGWVPDAVGDAGQALTEGAGNLTGAAAQAAYRQLPRAAQFDVMRSGLGTQFIYGDRSDRSSRGPAIDAPLELYDKLFGKKSSADPIERAIKQAYAAPPVQEADPVTGDVAPKTNYPSWVDSKYQNDQYQYIPHQWANSGRIVNKATGVVEKAQDDPAAMQTWFNNQGADSQVPRAPQVSAHTTGGEVAPARQADAQTPQAPPSPTISPAMTPAIARTMGSPAIGPGGKPLSQGLTGATGAMSKGIGAGFFGNPGAAASEMSASTAGGMDKANSFDPIERAIKQAEDGPVLKTAQSPALARLRYDLAESDQEQWDAYLRYDKHPRTPEEQRQRMKSEERQRIRENTGQYSGHLDKGPAPWWSSTWHGLPWSFEKSLDMSRPAQASVGVGKKYFPKNPIQAHMGPAELKAYNLSNENTAPKPALTSQQRISADLLKSLESRRVPTPQGSPSRSGMFGHTKQNADQSWTAATVPEPVEEPATEDKPSAPKPHEFAGLAARDDDIAGLQTQPGQPALPARGDDIAGLKTQPGQPALPAHLQPGFAAAPLSKPNPRLESRARPTPAMLTPGEFVMNKAAVVDPIDRVVKQAGFWEEVWAGTKAVPGGLWQGVKNLGRGAKGLAETAAGGIGTAATGAAAGIEAATDALGITDDAMNTSWDATKRMKDFTVAGAKNVGDVYGAGGHRGLFGEGPDHLNQLYDKTMDDANYSDLQKKWHRRGLGTSQFLAEGATYLAGPGMLAGAVRGTAAGARGATGLARFTGGLSGMGRGGASSLANATKITSPGQFIKTVVSPKGRRIAGATTAFLGGQEVYQAGSAGLEAWNRPWLPDEARITLGPKQSQAVEAQLRASAWNVGLNYLTPSGLRKTPLNEFDRTVGAAALDYGKSQVLQELKRSLGSSTPNLPTGAHLGVAGAKHLLAGTIATSEKPPDLLQSLNDIMRARSDIGTSNAFEQAMNVGQAALPGSFPEARGMARHGAHVVGTRIAAPAYPRPQVLTDEEAKYNSFFDYLRRGMHSTYGGPPLTKQNAAIDPIEGVLKYAAEPPELPKAYGPSLKDLLPGLGKRIGEQQPPSKDDVLPPVDKLELPAAGAQKPRPAFMKAPLPRRPAGLPRRAGGGPVAGAGALLLQFAKAFRNRAGVGPPRPEGIPAHFQWDATVEDGDVWSDPEGFRSDGTPFPSKARLVRPQASLSADISKYAHAEEEEEEKDKLIVPEMPPWLRSGSRGARLGAAGGIIGGLIQHKGINPLKWSSTEPKGFIPWDKKKIIGGALVGLAGGLGVHGLYSLLTREKEEEEEKDVREDPIDAVLKQADLLKEIGSGLAKGLKGLSEKVVKALEEDEEEEEEKSKEEKKLIRAIKRNVRERKARKLAKRDYWKYASYEMRTPFGGKWQPFHPKLLALFKDKEGRREKKRRPDREEITWQQRLLFEEKRRQHVLEELALRERIAKAYSALGKTADAGVNEGPYDLTTTRGYDRAKRDVEHAEIMRMLKQMPQENDIPVDLGPNGLPVPRQKPIAGEGADPPKWGKGRFKPDIKIPPLRKAPKMNKKGADDDASLFHRLLAFRKEEKRKKEEKDRAKYEQSGWGAHQMLQDYDQRGGHLKKVAQQGVNLDTLVEFRALIAKKRLEIEKDANMAASQGSYTSPQPTQVQQREGAHQQMNAQAAGAGPQQPTLTPEQQQVLAQRPQAQVPANQRPLNPTVANLGRGPLTGDQFGPGAQSGLGMALTASARSQGDLIDRALRSIEKQAAYPPPEGIEGLDWGSAFTPPTPPRISLGPERRDFGPDYSDQERILFDPKHPGMAKAQLPEWATGIKPLPTRKELWPQGAPTWAPPAYRETGAGDIATSEAPTTPAPTRYPIIPGLDPLDDDVQTYLHRGPRDNVDFNPEWQVPRFRLNEAVREQSSRPVTYTPSSPWPERLLQQRHGDRKLRDPLRPPLDLIPPEARGMSFGPGFALRGAPGYGKVWDKIPQNPVEGGRGRGAWIPDAMKRQVEVMGREGITNHELEHAYGQQNWQPHDFEQDQPQLEKLYEDNWQRMNQIPPDQRTLFESGSRTARGAAGEESQPVETGFPSSYPIPEAEAAYKRLKSQEQVLENLKNKYYGHYGPRDEQIDSIAEVGPSMGDLLFRARQFELEEGKPLKHTVKLPGKSLDINWMQDQAKEHGYWGGKDGEPAKSMTDLLFGTSAGRQFYKQMTEAQKQYAADHSNDPGVDSIPKYLRRPKPAVLQGLDMTPEEGVLQRLLSPDYLRNMNKESAEKQGDLIDRALRCIEKQGNAFLDHLKRHAGEYSGTALGAAAGGLLYNQTKSVIHPDAELSDKERKWLQEEIDAENAEKGTALVGGGAVAGGVLGFGGHLLYNKLMNQGRFTKIVDLTKTSKEAVVPRKRTYVGEGSQLEQEKVDELIRGYEAETGANLDKMPVLANKKQFWRNMARHYVPSSFRQAPGRLGRWAMIPFTFGASVLEAGESASMAPDDFYHPHPGTVNVGAGDKSTLAHEIGHYVDFEQNKSPYKRGLLGGRKNTRFNRGSMTSELAATLWARKAMGEGTWRRSGERQLLPALATYAADPFVTQRTFGEWLKRHPKVEGDPHWKRKLDKVLSGKDHAATDKLLQRAVKNEFDKIDRLDEPIIHLDERTGKFRWIKDQQSKHNLDTLMKKLVDSEYGRLYGQQKAGSAADPIARLLAITKSSAPALVYAKRRRKGAPRSVTIKKPSRVCPDTGEVTPGSSVIKHIARPGKKIR